MWRLPPPTQGTGDTETLTMSRAIRGTRVGVVCVSADEMPPCIGMAACRWLRYRGTRVDVVYVSADGVPYRGMRVV